MRKALMAALPALALTVSATAVQTLGAQSLGAQVPSMSQDWVPLTAAGGLMSSVDRLMDRTVIGSDGNAIGTITDVLLGPDGQARYLVVRNGGFLGFGGRHIAVNVGLAMTRIGEDKVRLRDMTRAEIAAMPDFTYDDAMTSLNRSPRSHDSAGR